MKNEFSIAGKALDQFSPGAFNRGPVLITWIGITAIFVTVLIKLSTSTSFNRFPEAVAGALFTVMLFRHWSVLVHDRGIQLLFCSLLLPPLLLGLNFALDGQTAWRYANFEKLASLMLFVPFAWWLGGSQKTILYFLAAGFAGLLIAALLDPNLDQELSRLFSGGRVDFNILNAQHLALYASLALIGFLSFSHRVLTIQNPTWKLVAGCFAVIGTLISLMLVVGSQTRAAWLALTLLAGVWLVFHAVYWAGVRRIDRKKIIGLVLLALAAIALILQFNSNIQDRVTRENEAWEAIADGDWDNIPYSSIGTRIHTWIEAGRWIREKPLIGWGGAVRSDVINQSDVLPDRIKRQYNHFHNVYIEFTLAYGLIGLAWLLYLFYWTARKVFELKKQGECPSDLATYTLFSVCLLGIMGFFESYLFFWSGAYVTLFVLGPAYSIILKHRMS